MKGKQNRQVTDKYRVALFKLLRDAPAPMTFDEIVKTLMMTPGNYSRACTNYQAHVGVTGDLDEHGIQEAKRWWVLDLLIDSKGPFGRPNNLFITSTPGHRSNGIRHDSPLRVWSANLDNQPWVQEDRVVTELVRLNEADGTISARASAGMRYLAELNAYRAKHPKIAAELVRLLESGEQAIRNRQP